MEQKRTPLYNIHKRAGATFVSFAGWEMPISYTGINEEHLTVREKAGLFDVSHMGDIWVEGKDAGEFLSHVLTMNPLIAKTGDCIYTHILNENGGIIDDMIATKFSETRYLCVPNASMTNIILDWFKKHSSGRNVSFKETTEDCVCIALQGPKANDLLNSITSSDLSSLKFFKAKMFHIEGDRIAEGKTLDEYNNIGENHILVSRTGYTGEDGFEFILGNNEGIWLWEKLMDVGNIYGIAPIGLGARDSLRLEKGFLLSGTDFDGDRTSLETGWDFAVSWDHDFIGKPILEKQKNSEHQKLRGLLLQKRAIPRHNMEVVVEGDVVGKVTSGGFSPILQKGIALAYLDPKIKKGMNVDVVIRGKKIPAEVVKTPFVK